jgi:hypothetical protein
MAYIHSTIYQQVESAIATAKNSTHDELMTLAKRYGVSNVDVTAVIGHGVVIEGKQVFIELEYEYFTLDDRCLISTCQIKII